MSCCKYGIYGITNVFYHMCAHTYTHVRIITSIRKVPHLSKDKRPISIKLPNERHPRGKGLIIITAHSSCVYDIFYNVHCASIISDQCHYGPTYDQRMAFNSRKEKRKKNKAKGESEKLSSQSLHCSVSNSRPCN